MNILFTCAGRRTYLLKYFKENMNPEALVVATDMQLSAPALQVADVKLQVPAVYDPQYVDITLDICKKYDIKLLISLNDLELPILAQNKMMFESLGVKLLLSDPNVIDICFDKYKTAQWVESIGLMSPKTYISIDEAKNAIARGELHYPLFMKPRWGSGSIGLEIINDEEELDICYALLRKKIKKTILATASIGDNYILIQEKLSGNEYGLDVINDLNGNHISVSVKQKLAMRAGETDKAIILNCSDIENIGHVVGCNLKHVGNLDVDIMQRGNGDYCVLELNPRFGGGFPFSYESGVNLPKAILYWMENKSVDISMLTPQYNKMFAKNDYLMEIK